MLAEVRLGELQRVPRTTDFEALVLLLGLQPFDVEARGLERVVGDQMLAVEALNPLQVLPRRLVIGLIFFESLLLGGQIGLTDAPPLMRIGVVEPRKHLTGDDAIAFLDLNIDEASRHLGRDRRFAAGYDITGGLEGTVRHRRSNGRSRECRRLLRFLRRMRRRRSAEENEGRRGAQNDHSQYPENPAGALPDLGSFRLNSRASMRAAESRSATRTSLGEPTWNDWDGQVLEIKPSLDPVLFYGRLTEHVDRRQPRAETKKRPLPRGNGLVVQCRCRT
ncbi:MAG TPA: hypothetical protein VGQ21_03245 [Thermoanaerobaculia bacterium]|nr:hypothetical protein [Thermoanaerobaculia bacterium]